MKKTLVILKREYLTRVRTKAFVIGTLVTPFLLGVLSILPGFLATRGGGDRQITVLDQTGNQGLFDALKSRLTGSAEDGTGEGDQKINLTHFSLTRVAVPPGQELNEDYIKGYTTDVESDSNKAVLVLPAGVLEATEVRYYLKNPSDFSTGMVERSL